MDKLKKELMIEPINFVISQTRVKMMRLLKKVHTILSTMDLRGKLRRTKTTKKIDMLCATKKIVTEDEPGRVLKFFPGLNAPEFYRF
jgi:hypothetical protein